MKKKALMLSTLLGALALAPAAFAQPDSGWYGAFDLGYHWPSGWKATSANDASDGRPYQFDFQTENTAVGFARLGYRMSPNWRVELEGGLRPGNVESARGDPSRPLPNELCNLSGIIPCRAPEGSIETWSLMGNVIYDFFPDSQFRPFIGVGVGANRAEVNIAGRGNAPVGAIHLDDTYTAFSWQVLAGLSFDVTERLNLDFT